MNRVFTDRGAHTEAAEAATRKGRCERVRADVPCRSGLNERRRTRGHFRIVDPGAHRVAYIRGGHGYSHCCTSTEYSYTDTNSKRARERGDIGRVLRGDVHWHCVPAAYNAPACNASFDDVADKVQ